jgi:hypothetical protein
MTSHNSSDPIDQLKPEQLVQSGLDSKVEAIAGYDAIIWKIRSGYVAILYGLLTLLWGKETAPDFNLFVHKIDHWLPILFLIFGISLSAFVIDFGYVQKKLKVVVIRNILVEIAYDQTLSAEGKLVKELLHIAAEISFRKHSELTDQEKHLPKEARVDYEAKLRWDIKRILLPLYGTTPALSLIIFTVLKFLVY